MPRGGARPGAGALPQKYRDAKTVARDIFYEEMTGVKFQKLVRHLYNMAMDGDTVAIKLILERLIPAIKEVHVEADVNHTVEPVVLTGLEWQTPEWQEQQRLRLAETFGLQPIVVDGTARQLPDSIAVETAREQ